jgi:hypothetical protein
VNLIVVVEPKQIVELPVMAIVGVGVGLTVTVALVLLKATDEAVQLASDKEVIE